MYLQHLSYYICTLKRIQFKTSARSAVWPFGLAALHSPWLSFISEVSWLSGREEAVWISPPETVTYQRPDHRLRPSTRSVVVAVRHPEQGVTRPDQKTPDGPKDCPHWVPELLRHYQRISGGEEGGHFSPKVSWDHRLVIKRGPLTWFLMSFGCHGWILFCCKRVRSLSKGQIHLLMKSRCDPFCPITLVSFVLSELIRADLLKYLLDGTINL